VLRAKGEAEAITTVFQAIHEGNPDGPLLSYQYLQTLPKLAAGEANKLWIIPSELTEALKGVGRGFLGGTTGGEHTGGAGAAPRNTDSPDNTAAPGAHDPARSTVPIPPVAPTTGP
jgi:hypothetical protein